MYDKRIDISKGIAAFLVVLTHAFLKGLLMYGYPTESYYNDIIFSIIGSFFMPLFMIISGYLFVGAAEKRSFKTIFYSKITSIVIPIFAWVYIFNGMRLLLGRFDGDLLGFLLSPMINMWFLWTLFFNMIVVKLGHDKFNDNMLFHIIVTSGLLFLPDVFDLKYYAFMYPVFVVGYYFRKNKLTIDNINMFLVTLIFALLLLFWDIDKYIYTTGSSVLSSNYPLEMFITNIYRWLIGVVGSLTVLKMVDIFNRKYNFNMNMLQKIGKKSLGIYFCDVFIGDQLIKTLAFIPALSIAYHWLLSILIAVVFIALYLIILKVLDSNKYTQQLFLGKSQQNITVSEKSI